MGSVRFSRRASSDMTGTSLPLMITVAILLVLAVTLLISKAQE
jgi:hypothetical protein